MSYWRGSCPMFGGREARALVPPRDLTRQPRSPKRVERSDRVNDPCSVRRTVEPTAPGFWSGLERSASANSSRPAPRADLSFSTRRISSTSGISRLVVTRRRAGNKPATAAARPPTLVTSELVGARWPFAVPADAPNKLETSGGGLPTEIPWRSEQGIVGPI
jgi:hypothetical protein